MKRRDFLKSAATALAGIGAGAAPILFSSTSAGAFGEAPPGAEASMVPGELRARSVLEIFLYGGLSQFESFYCVPEHGAADGTHWHAFLGSGEVQAAVNACAIEGPLIEPFAEDDDGQTVHLGPFVAPLRARLDIMDRARVVITAHDLEPHEAAIPLALAGKRLGHPALSGLGAHIQRYFLDRGGGAGGAPHSYVLLPASLSSQPTDNIRSAVAIGAHSGAARPLCLKVDAASELTAALSRGAVGAKAREHDALVDVYKKQAEDRLRFRGSGDPLRSPRMDDFAAAASAVAGAKALAKTLDPGLFQVIGGAACGDASPADAITMSLRLAARLITHPEAPARHVCVMDGGLLAADSGGGYDTHFENTHTQARNLTHMLRALTGVINEPGEGDPQKLDLDTTMILLTTEFGRTPKKQGQKGRNHWPYGYPTVVLGGPVRAGCRGVFGACGPDGRATAAASPAEHRIAALLSLGIWPFAPEGFSVADVPGATTEMEAATLVKARLLGLS